MPKLISRKIGEAGYSSFHTVCNKPVLQREKEINQKLLLNFRQINFQSSFHGIFVAKLSEVSSQCGNYANLLLLFYGKNKATYLLNNSLKRWFHENFWLRVNFSFFHTVSFMFCKYLHFGHEIRQMQFFLSKNLDMLRISEWFDSTEKCTYDFLCLIYSLDIKAQCGNVNDLLLRDFCQKFREINIIMKYSNTYNYFVFI